MFVYTFHGHRSPIKRFVIVGPYLTIYPVDTKQQRVKDILSAREASIDDSIHAFLHDQLFIGNEVDTKREHIHIELVNSIPRDPNQLRKHVIESIENIIGLLIANNLLIEKDKQDFTKVLNFYYEVSSFSRVADQVAIHAITLPDWDTNNKEAIEKLRDQLQTVWKKLLVLRTYQTDEDDTQAAIAKINNDIKAINTNPIAHQFNIAISTITDEYDFEDRTVFDNIKATYFNRFGQTPYPFKNPASTMRYRFLSGEAHHMRHVWQRDKEGNGKVRTSTVIDETLVRIKPGKP